MISKLIPFKRIVFKSPLVTDAIMQQLNSKTKSVGILFFELFPVGWLSSFEEQYIGKIDDSEFQLMRRSVSKKCYVPWIKGKAEKDATGSLIYVTMTMHPLIILFMIAYILVALWSTVGTGTISFGNLMLLGMYFFIHIFITITFWSEAAKDIRFLEELFRC